MKSVDMGKINILPLFTKLTFQNLENILRKFYFKLF